MSAKSADFWTPSPLGADVINGGPLSRSALDAPRRRREDRYGDLPISRCLPLPALSNHVITENELWCRISMFPVSQLQALIALSQCLRYFPFPRYDFPFNCSTLHPFQYNSTQLARPMSIHISFSRSVFFPIRGTSSQEEARERDPLGCWNLIFRSIRCCCSGLQSPTSETSDSTEGKLTGGRGEGKGLRRGERGW